MGRVGVDIREGVGRSWLRSQVSIRRRRQDHYWQEQRKFAGGWVCGCLRLSRGRGWSVYHQLCGSSGDGSIAPIGGWGICNSLKVNILNNQLFL